MAINVGLDFGTHQTKICIENSDSPLHKTYEFYEWEEGVYAFPSVIQINKDHTLRYGSVDMDTCLMARKARHITAPKELILPPKPNKPAPVSTKAVQLPPMPVHKFITKGGFSMSLPYSDLIGIESAGNENRKDVDPNIVATTRQKMEYRAWKEKCSNLKKKEAQNLLVNKSLQSKYAQDLKTWEEQCASLQASREAMQKRHEESLTEYPMVYRYFKQATFSAYKWEWEIKSADLTVLYLAYIIFKLEERFGNTFSVQMGVPASEGNFEKLKRFASGHLIQAYRLVEDVFENDFEKFLATPYEELLKLIPEFEYSDDLKTSYGILIIPEAYAALRSVTVNGRIPNGMNLMLDIGGGTTDISFFTIEQGEPHIYHFESLPKGLNFFLEYEDRHNFKSIDFTHQRELADIPSHIFKSAYGEYHTQLNRIVEKLTGFLQCDTISRGFQKSAFRIAMEGRPAIYTGGGSTDNRMRSKVGMFVDVKFLNKNILRLPHVIREDAITIPYSLLATSFGLSIQMENDNIKVSKKEELFAKYSREEDHEARLKAHSEYGLADL